MALFNFGKKKETAKATVCACSCGSPAGKAAKPAGTCCGKAAGGICCIKVLGSGCKNCHALLEASREAVRNMGLCIEVEYVTDMEKIMAYGVMRMPALVVNETVFSMGRVLKASEVEELLHKLGY